MEVHLAFDRMDWHNGADNFPEELDCRAGGTHIGMFLAWAIMNDLIGELHIKDSSDSIAAVKSRRMTGTEFLEQECDEKFWEEDLNEAGCEFAKHYYETDKYFDDYETILAENLPTLYHVDDSWENFNKISVIISKRFSKWQASKKKPRWQFW